MAHHVVHGAPQAAPVGAVEVQVVDVLVALGRVLGVLQRAVGPAVEPLRVLGQPRVVRGALQREVQRDLDAHRPRLRRQAPHVGLGPQLRVHGGVAAFGGPDRPWAARIARPRDERVARSLAVGDADRVDRRQVEDVEAQLGELRHDRAHAVQAAPGPGEQLVPGPRRGRGRDRPGARPSGCAPPRRSRSSARRQRAPRAQAAPWPRRRPPRRRRRRTACGGRPHGQKPRGRAAAGSPRTARRRGPPGRPPACAAARRATSPADRPMR